MAAKKGAGIEAGKVKRSGSNWLSDLQCRTAKEGVHGDGGGLYLQVQASKGGGGTVTRSWVYRYTSPATGKARWRGLGRYGAGEGDVGLQEARDLRDAARRQVRDGTDPIDAKEAQRQERDEVAQQHAQAQRTFKDVAELVLTNVAKGKKGRNGELRKPNAKHLWTWNQTLEKYAYPLLGERPIATITEADVIAVLQPLVDTDRVETARRTCGRIEQVFAHARAMRWYTDENPARRKENLNITMPALIKHQGEVENYAALGYRDVGAFMESLRCVPGVAARCLEFAILNASRSGEARGARWNEIDWNAAGGPIWTVPASRMKRRVEHIVPLSTAVVALLGTLGPKDDDSLIFPSTRKEKSSMSDMAMLSVLRRMKLVVEEEVKDEHGNVTGKRERSVVAHGFRATFSTWANEESGFSSECIEVALSHLTGTEVSRAYSRGQLLPRRRALMETWGGYLAQPLASATVMPLRKAAA